VEELENSFVGQYKSAFPPVGPITDNLWTLFLVNEYTASKRIASGDMFTKGLNAS
jgi:hypothetical protein